MTEARPSGPAKGMTWLQLGMKIETEGGIDYFFRCYMSPSRFTDKKLKELAANYCAAARELDTYLTDMGAYDEPGEGQDD